MSHATFKPGFRTSQATSPVAYPCKGKGPLDVASDVARRRPRQGKELLDVASDVAFVPPDVKAMFRQGLKTSLATSPIAGHARGRHLWTSLATSPFATPRQGKELLGRR